MGSLLVGFLAGTLSVLSPCVLPLLPIVGASALQRHRHGPLALAAGLALASAATGLFFASLGFVVDVDRDVGRGVAAGLMALVGVVLLVPGLQETLAGAAAPLASAGGALSARLRAGLGGQLLLGLLLGVVWTPCTGPTLAAAVTLAASSDTLGRAAALMLAFGLGAAVPVLALAYGSRRALAGGGAGLARLASIGRPAMGLLLLAVGALVLTGGDKAVEAWLIARTPDWLIDLTTAF